MKLLKNLLLLSIFAYAIWARLPYFDQKKKDVYAYQKAVEDLIMGKNPYEWTVASYANPDDPGNHGYAYLPGFLYINYVFFIFHLITKIPFVYLWKIPILLADIGVGLLLVKNLRKKYYLYLLLGLLVWFFNPYFYMKSNYVFFDPLPVFFMFLALDYLEKDNVLSGIFYALSILFKTFPLILFPIFVIKACHHERSEGPRQHSEKTRGYNPLFSFIVAGALIGLVASLPFMTSLQDFLTYLQGAIFVHGNRFIQGRPFLFYISYFYKIELFQIIPFKVYSLLSMLGGWLVIGVIWIVSKKKDFDKYVMSVIPFFIFYLFTPVLNRTYLIWGLPVLIMAASRAGRLPVEGARGSIWAGRDQPLRKALPYFIVGAYWLFYYFYLLPWKDGFHIWRP